MEFILWSYININTQIESQLQITDLLLVIISNSVILLVLVLVFFYFCYERNGKPQRVNEYNTIRSVAFYLPQNLIGKKVKATTGDDVFLERINVGCSGK